MTRPLRGADIVAQSLRRLGCTRVFTLSGNHIMSIFDAAIEAGLDLVHVRHEAAAVHMADAVGRLTGEPGVALVTGGPGHANALGALYTALGAESPLVLLSGHAATFELGRHGFQEIRQVDMAAPVTKTSWMAAATASLGRDIAEAFLVAASGRPGPVHVSLPSDILDATVPSDSFEWPNPRPPAASPTLPYSLADEILATIDTADRPLFVAGPRFAHLSGRMLLARLEAATGVPAVVMESPRGLADATLGAFADVARQADLVVLLGKTLDFTTRWAAAPAFHPHVRLVAIDPDRSLVEHAAGEMAERFLHGYVADVATAASMLIARAGPPTKRTAWCARARAAIDYRPGDWATVVSQTPGRLHPAEVFRVLRPYVERDPDTVLVCDGGEFSQWGQSMLPVRRRLINGVAGAIGSSLPFAAAARMIEPRAPVFAVLGDGTAGFHLSEFETAARRGLPYVAIIGNDACWNAESQIQLRDYGRNRMHGCDLLPAHYEGVAAALGGHGEWVEKAADLADAIERALASGKPACINVMVESIAAPALRL